MSDEDEIFKMFTELRRAQVEEPSWIRTDKPALAEALGFKVYYPGTSEYDAMFKDVSAETSDGCVMRGPKA